MVTIRSGELLYDNGNVYVRERGNKKGEVLVDLAGVQVGVDEYAFMNFTPS